MTVTVPSGAMCTKAIGIVDRAMRHGIGAVFRGRRCAGCSGGGRARRSQPTTRKRPAAPERTEKGAAAHVLDHHKSAARLIAARIRGYVPQRQMLPLIAASMSASLWFGLLLEQRRGGHDLSGLAIAALRHADVEPC